MNPPDDMYALAASHRGLLRREDLSLLGADDDRVHRLTKAGIIRRIGQRTFEVGGLGPDPLRSMLAACFDTGGVVSHRSATGLLGLTPLPSPRLPDVLVVRALRGGRSALATVHSTTNLPSDDVTSVDGIPCTSVARTILLLAGLAPREVSVDQVRNLVDDAIRRGSAKDAWLWWRLEKLRCRGRSGISVLEEILQARAGGEITESWLEREFLELVRAAGIPVPRCQARLARNGAFVARVDFIYEHLDLVVEVTGAVGHSTPQQRRADARRRNRLATAGMLVIEFTYEQIVWERAEVIVALLEAIASCSVARLAS